MSEVISIEESRRLVDLEKTIQSGLQTFVEVGEALAEIRDSRLYRIEYGTFEEYCKTKWKMSASRARQLIGASEIASTVKSVTIVTPDAESQTRPLTKLPAEQRAGAWEKAVKAAGGEQPTAKQVEEAVQEVSSPGVLPAFSPVPLSPSDAMSKAKQIGVMISRIATDDRQFLKAVSHIQAVIDRRVQENTKLEAPNAISYANFATVQLRKIRKTDPKRKEAAEMVIAWAQENLLGENK